MATDLKDAIVALEPVDPEGPTIPDVPFRMPTITQERIDRIVAKWRDAVRIAEEADEPTHVKLVETLRELFADDDYQEIAVSYTAEHIRVLPDPIEEAGLNAIYEAAQKGLTEAFDFILRQIDE